MCLLIKHRQNCCDCLLYRIFCKRKYVYSFYGSSCFFEFLSAAHQNLLNSVVGMDSVGTWGVWLRCLAWIPGRRGSNFGVGRVSPYNFDLGKNSVVQRFVVGRVSDVLWVKKSINVLFLFIILKVLPICIYHFWLMPRSLTSPRFPESFFTDVFDKSGRSEISLFQIYLKGIIKLCGYLISWLEQN